MAHCAKQTAEFELSLDAALMAVPRARAAFETWLQDVGAVGETADELSAVLSELVTKRFKRHVALAT